MMRIHFPFSTQLPFCLALAGLLLLATPLQAQKPKDFGIKSKKAMTFFLEGLQQQKYRGWEKAVEMHQKALELEPQFAEAHFRLGICLTVLYKFDEAVTHLETAQSLSPTPFGGIGYYLGQSYFFNEQYAEAVTQYQAYLAEGRGGPTFVKTVELNLRKAIFAKEAIQHPVDFKPVNLGPNINSKEDDTMPYLTADDQMLLFTSRRPGSTGGFSRIHKDYDEDFYVAIREADGWKKAANMGAPINTIRNEGAPSLSQDGRMLFFTMCNREDGFGACDLYNSFWNGSEWTEPQNLGPAINSEAWDSQPCISHDGKTLYFASNRRGGTGGSDIYYSEFIAGEWSEAQNIGAPINSKGDDDAPFLHADGVSLYFVSDYHNGFGNGDLFVSFKYGNGKWADPRNLGYPVNTAAEEGYIFVNAKGTKGFINSRREGGMGKNDLYAFELDETIRPQRATFLRGLTRDSITRAPVQARIRLVDVESGDTVRTLTSGKGDGRFLMSLPLEREYAAIVEAPRYLFASKHFYLKNLTEDTYFDLTIDLTPIQKGRQVVLNNIFFESGSYDLLETSNSELRFLLHFMKRNRNMRIEIQGHTDNVGSKDDNQSLSQNRAESVRKHLIDKGIDPSRITAKGYGESHPIDTNDSDEGRAKNRRTEFKVLEL